MEIQELRKKLVEYETKINDYVIEMDKLTEEFISKATPVIIKKMNDEIENKIFKESIHTKEVGLENLKQLKKDVAKLLDEMPRIINSGLNIDSLWAQRGKLIIEKYEHHSTRYTYRKGFLGAEDLDNKLKSLANNYVSLLQKYGYKITNAREQNYPTSEPKYYFYFEWNDEMKNVLNLYEPLFISLTKTIWDKQQIQKDIQEQEAKDIWNKV